MRPELSPDGRWLAYATRNKAETSLDAAAISPAAIEPFCFRRCNATTRSREPTATSFRPTRSRRTAKSIVIGTPRPFLARRRRDRQGDADPVHRRRRHDDRRAAARHVRGERLDACSCTRFATCAVAGRQADRVRRARPPVDDGSAERHAEASYRGERSGEFQPAWSPDGQYIAYVTWNDVDGGTVSRMRADGTGRPDKLTSKPAYYEKPAYSIDGRRIVVGRGPRNMRQGSREDERPPAAAVGVELVWLPGNGGAETLIAPISNFGRPHFVKSDPDHVYFAEGTQLVSMRWDGTDQKTILRSAGGGGRGGGGGGGGGAGEMMMSPDGSKVLVQVEDQAGPRVVSRRGHAEDGKRRRRSTRRIPRSPKCPCAR